MPQEAVLTMLIQGIVVVGVVFSCFAGLTVIEDFGHHPTALAATLDSLRARHPDARLTAVFEARSNTARTKRMQDAFTGALARTSMRSDLEGVTAAIAHPFLNSCPIIASGQRTDKCFYQLCS